MARSGGPPHAGHLSPKTAAEAGAASAAALVLAAGCGTSTKVVDASTVRPVIDKQIRVSGAPPAQSVSCPETDAAAGKTLTCHVTLQDGAAYDLTIRIDKIIGQRPLLTVVASRLRIVGPSNVKPLIDDQLSSTHLGAARTTTCQHVAAKVGVTFTCTVTLVNGHIVTDGFRLQALGATGPTFAIHGISIR